MLARLPHRWRAMLVGTMALVLTSAAAAAPPVWISTGEYPPLASQQVRGKGLLSEIVALTMQEMATPPAFAFLPWKRGQNEVRTGRMWATFPYVKTPEREAAYWFSKRPLIENRILLFHLRSRFPGGLRWERLEDLRPYVLGGVRGYWYEGALARAGLEVDYTTSVEASMRKLRKGRIDLFPVTELVGWHTIRQLFPDEIDRFATADREYEIVPSYLMVSRKYPHSRELLDRFDATFERLHASGAFDHILKRYLAQR